MTATLASPVGGGPRFGEGRLHIFSPCPPLRIAARRIRACAARARTDIPPRRGLGIASLPVLRTVDGRSSRSTGTDCSAGDGDRLAVPIRIAASPATASPSTGSRATSRTWRRDRAGTAARRYDGDVRSRLHPGIASVPVLRTVDGRSPRSAIPSMRSARNRTSRRRLRAASSAATTMARPRVRPPLPCRTSPPRDEPRILCAGPASAPSPMATSAATSRPTLAMTVLTSALRQPRSRASALRPRLPFGSPSPDRCGRVPSL